MAILIPADFAVATKKPWCEGLTLGEEAGDSGASGYLVSVITQIQERLENELNDTFEPPNPDNDITIDVNGSGTQRLFVPRRVRSITTVKTRDSLGNLVAEASTLWRLTQSATGADFTGSEYDYLDVIPGQFLSTGSCWPWGTQTVQIVGKFGWASTPTDIKRLTALLVYDYLKPTDGKLRKTERLQTDTQTFSFIVPEPGATGIRGADDIIRRYRRQGVLVR